MPAPPIRPHEHRITTAPDALEDRVGRLERRSKWTVRGLIAAAVVGIASLVWASYLHAITYTQILKMIAANGDN